MNTKQAKQLSLPEIMARFGHQPFMVKKGGTELWYLSPFRTEAKPSFVTSYLGGKWIWKDFGDEGGTVIDFVMRHENFSKVGDALAFLENLYGTGQATKAQVPENNKTLFSFKPQQNLDASSFEKQLEFIKAAPISNSGILKYLTGQRCIPEKLCRKYLQQITYRNKKTGKEFFAFGMENRAGGYEIRAATDDFPFKSALICRDITVIEGSDPSTETVSVFEGMTDFLSLLALTNVEALQGGAIVMHSLSSFEKTIAYIREKQFRHIALYLDNDRPGQETTAKFIAMFGHSALPKNETYLPHKDVNDMLRARIKP